MYIDEDIKTTELRKYIPQNIERDIIDRNIDTLKGISENNKQVIQKTKHLDRNDMGAL